MTPPCHESNHNADRLACACVAPTFAIALHALSNLPALPPSLAVQHSHAFTCIMPLPLHAIFTSHHGRAGIQTSSRCAADSDGDADSDAEGLDNLQAVRDAQASRGNITAAELPSSGDIVITEAKSKKRITLSLANRHSIKCAVCGQAGHTAGFIGMTPKSWRWRTILSCSPGNTACDRIQSVHMHCCLLAHPVPDAVCFLPSEETNYVSWRDAHTACMHGVNCVGYWPMWHAEAQALCMWTAQ